MTSSFFPVYVLCDCSLMIHRKRKVLRAELQRWPQPPPRTFRHLGPTGVSEVWSALRDPETATPFPPHLFYSKFHMWRVNKGFVPSLLFSVVVGGQVEP